MKHLSIAFVPLALSTLASAQEPPQTLDASEAAAGQNIYSRYCAACHGKEGRGDGTLASGLTKRPPDLTTLTSKNDGKFPFDKVARSIDGRETPRAHGTTNMPAWGEVFGKTTGTESPTVEGAVKRITHYVWSIQK